MSLLKNNIEFQCWNKLLSIALVIVVGSIIFLPNNIAWGQNAESKRTFGPSLIFERKIDLSKLNIYMPMLMAVDDLGNVALFDYGQFGLVVLPEKNYKSPKWISKGKGSGPREFRGPTDLKFGPDGMLWVVDPVQGRITVWNSTSELDTTYSHIQKLPKSIVVGDQSFVVESLNYIPQEGLFSEYTKQGKLLKSFGALPQKLTKSVLLYLGKICTDSKALYFAGLSAGFIKKWNLSGNKVYSVKTVVPVHLPKMAKRTISVHGHQITAKLPTDEAREASVRIDVEGCYIYDLFSGEETGLRLGKGGGKFIDLYNKKQKRI